MNNQKNNQDIDQLQLRLETLEYIFNELIRSVAMDTKVIETMVENINTKPLVNLNNEQKEEILRRLDSIKNQSDYVSKGLKQLN